MLKIKMQFLALSLFLSLYFTLLTHHSVRPGRAVAIETCMLKKIMDVSGHTVLATKKNKDC